MRSPIVNFALFPYLGAHAHAREKQIHLIPNLRGAVTSDAQLADGCGLQGLWESAEDICKLISVDGGETQGDCGTSHGFNFTADPSDSTIQGTAFWNHDGSDKAVDVIGFFQDDCRLEFESTTTSMTYAGKVKDDGIMEIEATQPGEPKAIVYAGKFQQPSKLSSASQVGDFATGDSNCNELEGKWRAAAYMYRSVSIEGGYSKIDRVKNSRFVLSMDPANTTKTFDGTWHWTSHGNDYNTDVIGFYKEDCSIKFVSTTAPLTWTGKIKGGGLMEIEATLPAMQGTNAFTMTGMYKHEGNNEGDDSDASDDSSDDSSESDSCNLEGAWDSTEPICKFVSFPPGATALKMCNTSHSFKLVADPGDSRGTLEGTMIFEFPNGTISSKGLIGFYEDDCTLKLVGTNSGHTLSGKVDDNGVMEIDATFPGGGEAAVTWTEMFEQS